MLADFEGERFVFDAVGIIDAGVDPGSGEHEPYKVVEFSVLIALLSERGIEVIERRASSGGDDVSYSVAKGRVERVLMAADRRAELQLHQERMDFRPNLLNLTRPASVDAEGRMMKDRDAVPGGRSGGGLLEPVELVGFAEGALRAQDEDVAVAFQLVEVEPVQTQLLLEELLRSEIVIPGRAIVGALAQVLRDLPELSPRGRLVGRINQVPGHQDVSGSGSGDALRDAPVDLDLVTGIAVGREIQIASYFDDVGLLFLAGSH